MNKPQQNAPGDWRKGGYRDAYEPIPPPPRKPTKLAQELIHSYQGTQRSIRIIGIVLLAIAFPLTVYLGNGLPTDIVLSMTSKPGTATILSHRILQNVEINDQHPLAVKYEYEVDGAKYTGESYTVHVTAFESLQVGASVPIEYLPTKPSWSRARATTASVMGLSTLFFYIFPLIGFAMYDWARRANNREIRAFRDGKPTKGLIIKRGIDETVEIDGKNPYEIVWEFHVDGVRYTGKLSNMKSEPLEKAFPTNEVTVLYDIHDPKVNTVWLE